MSWPRRVSVRVKAGGGLVLLFRPWHFTTTIVKCAQKTHAERGVLGLECRFTQQNAAKAPWPSSILPPTCLAPCYPAAVVLVKRFVYLMGGSFTHFTASG
ncbi:hypothetical protein SLE2022_100050 [Rubroshorea leprosula]